MDDFFQMSAPVTARSRANVRRQRLCTRAHYFRFSQSRENLRGWDYMTPRARERESARATWSIDGTSPRIFSIIRVLLRSLLASYYRSGSPEDIELWSRIAKNWNVSSGSLACPFACLLAPLTHSFALQCSFRSRTSLHSLAHSNSQALEKMNDKMAIFPVIVFYSGP